MESTEPAPDCKDKTSPSHYRCTPTEAQPNTAGTYNTLTLQSTVGTVHERQRKTTLEITNTANKN